MLFEIIWERASSPNLPGFRHEVLKEGLKQQQQAEQPIAPPTSRLGIAWLPRHDAMEPIVISRVIADSPAAQAGISVGDRIIQVNGLATSEVSDLVGLVRSAPPEMRLLIERDGEPSLRELLIKLRGTPIRLGVQWRTDAAEPESIIITGVVPGSPAARAGIRRHDRVYRLEPSDMPLADWFRLLPEDAAWPLSMQIERNGRVQEFLVELPPVHPLTNVPD